MLYVLTEEQHAICIAAICILALVLGGEDSVPSVLLSKTNKAIHYNSNLYKHF